MWPPSLWLYPLMPWLIATRLPAAFFEALMIPPTPAQSRPSAEIIPFPVRRAAAG